MMRKSIIWAVVAVAVLALSWTAVNYASRERASDVEILTDQISRGSIVAGVRAIGTVEAVETVQVGAEVTGIVQELDADFNSIVYKGQVLARLDPSLLEAQREQSRASLTRSEVSVENVQINLDATARDLARAQQLRAKDLISPVELEAAEVANKSAKAQLVSAQAQLESARAALAQIETDITKTVIRAPIDGIVLSRDVDVGQTVSAKMSAPQLFLLAADMSRMRVNTSIDESDVGRVKAGQPVTFLVNAFLDTEFTGIVRQVRLEPVLTNNVVSYSVMIDVPNNDLKLRPGMTADVTIETARRDDVLRIPNAALRFRPTTDTLKLLGASSQTVDDKKQPDTWVWVMKDGAMTPVKLETGMTDGIYTELLGGPIEEGGELVTGVMERPTATTPAGANPLMPTRRGGFGHFH
jgi:HlyD family secretion protein